MKKVTFAIMAILMTLLLFSPTMVNANSPRHCKGLDVYFYGTPEKAYAALKAGEIDFLQWGLTYEQYVDAVEDPTIQLAGFAENGKYEIDINNNYTIADFPGVRSPTNDLRFRQALAHMVDKDWLVNVVVGGFGSRNDVPLAAPQSGYGNESCMGDNYPYPYDMAAAAALLNAAGFTDTDDPDTTRNYPADWPGRPGRPNLDPIKVCVRNDHDPRLQMGRALCDNMRALDIPVNQIEDTSPNLHPIVMTDMNYHLYTGGWILGVRPTYLYGLYNSINWYPDGSDYVTGMDSSNSPNYPDLDAATDDIYYAKDIDMFKAAIKTATGLIVCDYCITIELYSAKSWWAYSKNLVGVVNMEGYGLENTYTFLNAKKCDNPATPQDESQEPIRMGTINPAHDLNILYSMWYFDYAVLDRVFTVLLATNPYNLAIDNPWVAQDWEVTKWYDPQDMKNKTKVTFWIRKDVFWHAPVTGMEVRQFTAHDVEFTIWYNYIFDDSWQWGNFKDVHHTKIIDDFTIEVYFDEESMWFVYAAGYPLLPKNEYLPLLCKEETCELVITEPRVPSDKDILPCGPIVQIISATLNGATPLIEGVDYEVFATGPPDYVHNEIHWLRPLIPGDVVVFVYWTKDLDPHGYYLGAPTLDWTDTFYSIGPYYPISIDPLTGATLNCNPSHFLGAPPDGEIDWMWYWVGTTKPRSGYYQVTLPDAIYLLKSYCARGDGVPSPNWFPGADIDSYDKCHVGLYDAVLLLTSYGKKFGIPPP